jgi:hypothetical protein
MRSPRERRDLEMMANPKSWPNKSLCLKKYLPEHQMAFADLFDGGPGEYVFIPTEGDTNLLRRGRLDMLEELILEGWMVD